MSNFKVAVRTTVLLMDDDIQQLDLLALTMKMSGFSVATASGPIDSLSESPSSISSDLCVSLWQHKCCFTMM
jgi:ActR/RegA family two-component response regulator